MARSYIALDTHCSFTDMAVVNVAGKLILTQQAPDGDAKSGASLQDKDFNYLFAGGCACESCLAALSSVSISNLTALASALGH
jgi:hypothetical protein